MGFLDGFLNKMNFSTTDEYDGDYDDMDMTEENEEEEEETAASAAEEKKEVLVSSIGGNGLTLAIRGAMSCTSFSYVLLRLIHSLR